MITRLSTLFLRTLRDDPADAEVPSHRLLVRGGYVRAEQVIDAKLPEGIGVRLGQRYRLPIAPSPPPIALRPTRRWRSARPRS